MKTTLHILKTLVVGATLLAAVPAQAQTFPNNSLDTWAVRNGIDSPTNWQTTNDIAELMIGIRFPTPWVVKTAVTHSGPFAAQLQTQTLLGLGQVPGVITLGNSARGIALPLGSTLPPGLPFTARPANIQFYYQLSGPQAVADSAAMQVKLMRRVGGVATVIAQARYYMPTLASTYTLVSVPLQYSSTLAPDSVSLVFLSGSARSAPITVGTELRIDDVSFTGIASATRNAALDAVLSVAPNPSATGSFTLRSSEPALLAAAYTVTDALGRVVTQGAQVAPAATRQLELPTAPAGLYTLQLHTTQGVLTRKLMVE